MGLEMVRVGSKQKNIYVELNEVGVRELVPDLIKWV